MKSTVINRSHDPEQAEHAHAHGEPRHEPPTVVVGVAESCIGSDVLKAPPTRHRREHRDPGRGDRDGAQCDRNAAARRAPRAVHAVVVLDRDGGEHVDRPGERAAEDPEPEHAVSHHSLGER